MTVACSVDPGAPIGVAQHQRQPGQLNSSPGRELRFYSVGSTPDPSFGRGDGRERRWRSLSQAVDTPAHLGDWGLGCTDGYWRVMATRRRCSGVMRWSWSSSPMSSWTQWIRPVNVGFGWVVVGDG